MEPIIELYHNDLSSCAQKVRIALYEKQLPWKSHHLNLRKGDQFKPEYMKLNPNGVVPTLVHGDRVVIESNVILEYIEDTFPEPSLSPSDPADLEAMRLWLRRLDADIHRLTGILTIGISTRHEYLAEGPEGVAKAVDQSPDENKRKAKRSLIELGIDAPLFPTAVAQIDQLFSDMDHTLCSTGWLAGKAFSLADIAYMPYLARYDFLGLAPFWAECRALSDWFARVKGRPSFTKVNIDEVAPKRIAEMVANGRANSARLLEIRQSVRATA